MLGLAKGCLESVLPYIHDRQAFGQPVADFQVYTCYYVIYSSRGKFGAIIEEKATGGKAKVWREIGEG